MKEIWKQPQIFKLFFLLPSFFCFMHHDLKLSNSSFPEAYDIHSLSGWQSVWLLLNPHCTFFSTISRCQEPPGKSSPKCPSSCQGHLRANTLRREVKEGCFPSSWEDSDCFTWACPISLTQTEWASVLYCCYKTPPQTLPGRDTQIFRSWASVSPFARWSNKAIIFYFTQNFVSEILFSTTAEWLSLAS